MLDFIARLFSFDPNSPLLFTQFYFWAFFALVYSVFALVGSRKLLRNAFLFFVSLLFYYKTSGLSVLILLFVTCSDFLISHRMEKAKSKGRGRRIPERVLLWVARLGGGVGCWLGMMLFRHKTKHLKFVLGIPAILIAQIVLACLILAKF